MTLAFLVIGEALFFLPAIARYRLNTLQNRLELAELAALVVQAVPQDPNKPEEEAVPQGLADELLATAKVQTVALRREGVRELALAVPDPPLIQASYDITDPSMVTLVRSAVRVLLSPQDRIIQVIGRTERQGEIEITMNEAPLRAGMIAYALRILYFSLGISVSVAALLFYALQRLFVRPTTRLVASMIAYRDDPENAGRVIKPRSGALEIRKAEEALRELQVGLTASLKQKERLAALGSAVAKISHDLRNLLTTAQLLADRIDASSDPKVKRIAPKLVSSLSRAITLCERTLTFGKAEEPPPVIATIPLAPLVAEVVEAEARTCTCARILAEVPPQLLVRADSDQLFRVLSNLVRNAVQAIEASGKAGSVTIAARRTIGGAEITVADTGPGLPEKARENLFQPFRGGVRQGGTGLGLVIAAELTKGHGGTLSLAGTGPTGTTFRLTLPLPEG
ncbi:MAG: HAMP domain-containing sensor histidine kinase [Amaricoccus sp.]